MSARPPKLGAKGWCRTCGFEIVVEMVSNGSFFPKYHPAWVHATGANRSDRHCFFVAEPKRHKTPPDRTLYEQIGDLKTALYLAERALEDSRLAARATPDKEASDV